MELAEHQIAPPGIEQQDTGNRISVSSEEASSPHLHVPSNNETNNAVAGANGDSSEGEDGSEGADRLRVKTGGEIVTPAFALLDGVVYVNDGDDAKIKSVTIPITRLPATFGRSHDTSDPNFFGLGPKKAVSREQCRIFYQDAFGGMLEQKGSSDALTYQLPKGKPPKDVVFPANDGKPLPSKGFYAIECLGKNKIVVGKHRLEQGEVALLESGTPIKISNYCLYFLLPTDAPQKTMSIPNPAYKKPKKPASNRVFAGGALKKKLEDTSTEDLIEEITALRSHQLGHRHKLLRSVVIARGVLDAARAKPIRQLAKKTGSVSKFAIMTWLAESPMYSEYVKHTLTTLEVDSYRTSVNKAFLKAGFVRIGSAGRNATWKLPKLDYESDLSDGDSEEANDGENDGPEKVSKGDDNDDKGIGKNDLDEDGNYNESDQEDEKEGLRENQGVGKDSMDEDSDDNESDHEEEKESLQQNRVVGKDDTDDDGDDNANGKEDKKDILAQSEGVGKDSGEGYGDSSPDDVDEFPSPDKTGDKEIAVGNEEDSNNVKMDVMDDDSDSSNKESPEADNYKVESHESGKHMDIDLPASDGKGNENMDLDGDSVNRTGESVTKIAADDPMMGEKEAKSQE